MRRVVVTAALLLIGGAVGFLLPLIVLMALAALVSWCYGDPAAGGALSFLMIPLGPIAVVTGVIIALRYANGLYAEGRRNSKPLWPGPGRRDFFRDVFGPGRGT